MKELNCFKDDLENRHENCSQHYHHLLNTIRESIDNNTVDMGNVIKADSQNRTETKKKDSK